MTKPDWCPQRVWDEAVEHWRADGCSAGSAIGYARAILAAEKRADERAAKILDDECARVLGKQDGVNRDVDRNLRMLALLLPDLATAIRNRNGE